MKNAASYDQDIDWDFWRLLDAVRVWEAGFLTCGLDPHKRSPDCRDFDDFIDSHLDLKKRLLLLKANLHKREYFKPNVNNMGDSNLSKVSLAEVAEWARQVGIAIPDQLAAFAKSNAKKADLIVSDNPDSSDEPRADKKLPWEAQARIEAARIYLEARALGYTLAKESISEKVAEELQLKGIESPRGGPLTAGNILRMALQGGWKLPKYSPTSAGKTGITGKQ
ncbi:hypothetical protein [Lacisediminimonas profundi]|uniref:hypothetical protein n=1 Tax=Lacisediminimonas profundi TaxID=2603856 RepID=UPI00124B4E7D|nr:hypothetical protein [Lacisediminimonas profundi]